jgi:hypothetical protein
MLRDSGDATIQPFAPYMLLSAATATGCLVTNIKYVVMPNPKGPNPRGHRFSDNQKPIASPLGSRSKNYNRNN